MSATPQAPVVIPPVPPRVLAIKKVLDTQYEKIAEICGKHLDPERLFRVAMATIYKSPKLQECDPWSIANCLVEAAQIGVEVGGPQDEAYMIPRKSKHSGTVQACFQLSYKGLMKVVIDSGAALSIHAGVAHANDEFDFSEGITPFVHHKKKLVDRGDPIAAWCAGKLPSGEPFVDIMSVSDVEKRRAASQDPNSLMWKDYWDEGAMKTVIRHACKKLKGASPKLSAALDIERQAEYQEMARAITERPMPKRLSHQTTAPAPEPEPQPQAAEEAPEQTQAAPFTPTPEWDALATSVTDLCAELGKDTAVIEHIRLAKAQPTAAEQIKALKASVDALAAELKLKREGPEQSGFALAGEEPRRGKGK